MNLDRVIREIHSDTPVKHLNRESTIDMMLTHSQSRWRWRVREFIGLLPTRYWKDRVSKCCWWIHANWRGCRGATRRQTRPIASGFSGCTLADYCAARFGRRKPSPLPNANKAQAIRKRGQEAKRQALFRMSGVDVTQIDAIGVETVEVVLSEYGPDLSRFP